jgi:cytochrome P450
MAKVQADRSLVPGFVEETLRFLTPSNNMWRVATQDAQVGGFEIKKGEMILVRYGSGNRDEGHFANANAFDVTRPNVREHLAFGAGIHTCLAAPLARKEMNTAFPILLDRLKNVRLQEGRNTFRYSPNILLRGVLELHVSFDKG